MIYAVFSEEKQASFDFVDGLLPSLVCIIIVFLILALLTLILSGVNKIKRLDDKEEPKKIARENTNIKKRIKLEEINDEDMMTAVLVATIDYREEVKTDVELVNVKQL